MAHGDLSAHLHTHECNLIIDRYNNCLQDNPYLRYAGVCTDYVHEVFWCCKAERLCRRELNRQKVHTSPPNLPKHLPERFWTPASFTKFADKDFDSVEWLNEAFSGADPQDYEKVAMSLLSKLQISMQELSKSIDDTTQEAISTMPRISREVDAMSQEALVLQKQMRNVQHDVHKVEQDTVTAMDALLKLDDEKSALSAEVTVLREVENWASLTADIEEVFGSGNADQMAERLRALNTSLKALQLKVSDYAERRAYLDQLTDQFVTVISPSVLNAFTSLNSDNVQYFARIFNDLDRSQEFHQYYCKCLKIDLGKKWEELKVSPSYPEASELHKAYNALVLKTFTTQLKWCERTFSAEKAPFTVSQALTQCLHQLNEQVASCLREKLSETQEQCATLNHIKLDTDEFVSALAAALPTVDGFEHSDAAQALLDVVFEPVVSLAHDYQQYMQTQLLARLNKYSFDDGSLSENIKRLDGSIGPVLADARHSLDAAQVFMGTIAVVPAVKALQTYLSNYMSKARKCAASLSAAVTAHIKEDDADNAPESGRLPVAENWQLTEQALKLVHCNGRLLSECSRLQEELSVAFSRLAHDVHSNQQHSGRQRRSTTTGSSAFECQLLANAALAASAREFVSKYTDEHGNPTKFLSDFEKSVVKMVSRTNRETMKLILAPIASLMEPLPKLAVWESAHVGESLEANLPSFSFIPQEYITKIGQYLMTLAHHLEPYLNVEDRSMSVALQRCPLPNLESDSAADEGDEAAARQWLRASVLGLMARYVEMCLRIRKLSAPGAKQLAVDIDYLCNVAEDLGLTASHDLQSLHALLKMTPSQLKSAHGYSPTMLAAVRQMRVK